MVEITGKSTLEKLVTSSGITIIDCYTPTCVPCKLLKKTLERVEQDMNVTIYTVNCEAYPELASYLNVSGVPTLFILENGIPLYQETGSSITYDKICNILNG